MLVKPKPIWRWLPILLAATLACNTLAPTPAAPTRAAATPTELGPAATAVTALPSPTATALPATATAAPTETPTLAATPTELGQAVAPSVGYQLSPASVHFHPDPQLYSGDIVSIEVVADDAPQNWSGAAVRLYIGERGEEPLARVNFTRYGLGGRLQATFTWVWDTAGRSGPQTVILVVSPGPVAGETTPPEQELTLSVNLLPSEARPQPEPEAQWAEAESACCLFHYLTGTAAARDIDVIRAQADAAFAHVAATLGVTSEQKVGFTLVSRLLGHGGFASSEISLSYLDRNPAVTELFSVFAHEGTHLLDRQIATVRPTMMVEGLAVYVAGGHFKTEPLDARAAAVLALDRYIPLADLANGFYPAQHEIGYLEAGAFINYLVERDGWETFKGMYATFQSAPTDAAMLDAALRAHYGVTLADLEAEWLAYLRAQPADPAQVEDLRLTVALFDTLRRYQQLKDPAAYFLSAWLPDGREARRRNIVGDFVRHPLAPDNIALEAMLDAAGMHLHAGEYAPAADLLAAVNAALDADDLHAAPLAADYLRVVEQLAAAGYEVQALRLDGPTALVSAIRAWPTLETLTLTEAAGGDWQITAGN
ncbi:MAG: hypothetical protein IT317_04830 [Anaerolineales bacterium]|nr:hypothetical protein [Anaerolineales bacterium]